MALDPSIRFAGKIVNRQLVSYARRDNAIPYLDEEMSNMAHYQVTVKSMMDNIFNGKIGKTRWIVAAREMVKLITIYQHSGILIISTDISCNHDRLVQRILDGKSQAG